MQKISENIDIKENFKRVLELDKQHPMLTDYSRYIMNCVLTDKEPDSLFKPEIYHSLQYTSYGPAFEQDRDREHTYTLPAVYPLLSFIPYSYWSQYVDQNIVSNFDKTDGVLELALATRNIDFFENYMIQIGKIYKSENESTNGLPVTYPIKNTSLFEYKKEKIYANQINAMSSNISKYLIPVIGAYFVENDKCETKIKYQDPNGVQKIINVLKFVFSNYTTNYVRDFHFKHELKDIENVVVDKNGYEKWIKDNKEKGLLRIIAENGPFIRENAKSVAGTDLMICNAFINNVVICMYKRIEHLLEKKEDPSKNINKEFLGEFFEEMFKDFSKLKLKHAKDSVMLVHNLINMDTLLDTNLTEQYLSKLKVSPKQIGEFIDEVYKTVNIEDDNSDRYYRNDNSIKMGSINMKIKRLIVFSNIFVPIAKKNSHCINPILYILNGDKDQLSVDEYKVMEDEYKEKIAADVLEDRSKIGVISGLYISKVKDCEHFKPHFYYNDKVREKLVKLFENEEIFLKNKEIVNYLISSIDSVEEKYLEKQVSTLNELKAPEEYFENLFIKFRMEFKNNGQSLVKGKKLKF